MNREVLFAKTLEEVKMLAMDQGGYVEEEQVKEAFEALSLDNEQLQLVFDYLVKHKVGIGAPVDLNDYLSEEEKHYLQSYLDEIDQLDKVSDGEKEAITLSAMAGDVDAQARLMTIFLPEVIEIAKIYTGQGVLLEDLIGEGNLALTMGVTMLGCAENVTDAQGMLARMIMDAMEEYIAENADAEKADLKIVDKVNKVMEKAKELSKELHREVTVQELMEETRMSEKTIRDAIRFSGHKIEYIRED